MDHAEEIKFFVRENALIARVAAIVLKGRKVAIVVGRTIYLNQTSEEELLKSTAWLRHELMHVQQYRQHGAFLFIVKYLWESCRKGYKNNPYEIEARAAAEILDFEKKFKVVSRRRSW